MEWSRVDQSGEDLRIFENSGAVWIRVKQSEADWSRLEHNAEDRSIMKHTGAECINESRYSSTEQYEWIIVEQEDQINSIRDELKIKSEQSMNSE